MCMLGEMVSFDMYHWHSLQPSSPSNHKVILSSSLLSEGAHSSLEWLHNLSRIRWTNQLQYQLIMNRNTHWSDDEKNRRLTYSLSLIAVNNLIINWTTRKSNESQANLDTNNVRNRGEGGREERKGKWRQTQLSVFYWLNAIPNHSKQWIDWISDIFFLWLRSGKDCKGWWSGIPSSHNPNRKEFVITFLVLP